MGMGWHVYCKVNGEVGTGVQVGGEGQVMGNGVSTGVTAGQAGVAGSEMTGELADRKCGTVALDIVTLPSKMTLISVS